MMGAFGNSLKAVSSHIYETIEISETEHINDHGPAPQRPDASKTDNDDSTISGVSPPKPRVNAQARGEADINKIVSEFRDCETEEKGPTNWCTISNTLANHYLYTNVWIHQSLLFHSFILLVPLSEG